MPVPKASGAGTNLVPGDLGQTECLERYPAPDVDFEACP